MIPGGYASKAKCARAARALFTAALLFIATSARADEPNPLARKRSFAVLSASFFAAGVSLIALGVWVGKKDSCTTRIAGSCVVHSSDHASQKGALLGVGIAFTVAATYFALDAREWGRRARLEPTLALSPTEVHLGLTLSL